MVIRVTGGILGLAEPATVRSAAQLPDVQHGLAARRVARNAVRLVAQPVLQLVARPMYHSHCRTVEAKPVVCPGGLSMVLAEAVARRVATPLLAS